MKQWNQVGPDKKKLQPNISISHQRRPGRAYKFLYKIPFEYNPRVEKKQMT